ncbi:GNAT family N-acetyltransferase [Cytobacillus dafuensis]|uniref:GNAT family N-acetyltransferase n=1 Tax=Cytobacillus dafuensis TaxID=1742359 RepID=A0A5B8Z8A0_CYTDA|nr:GNAT family N-acetyltransferase [Cytobacillus dafuensis]QED49315.1 GNAT family N-acetyltransferase [Cytobacillus dafuensis]
MIKEIDIRNRELAEEVLKVQIPSYMVEAEIIGFSDIPPLKDTVDTLQQCGETFFGYYIDEELCGAISIKVEMGEIDIHRLIVHPDHFRNGIAQRLLDFVEFNIECKEEIEIIKVSTGFKNAPAVSLYIKNGFHKVDEVRVNEQLSLTFFEKKKLNNGGDEL